MLQNDQDKVFPDIDDMYHIDRKTINQSIDQLIKIILTINQSICRQCLNTNQACITENRLNTGRIETDKDYPLYLTLEYAKKVKMPDL